MQSEKCTQCFLPSKFFCGKCKNVKYCSQSCAKFHWKQGHRITCKLIEGKRDRDDIVETYQDVKLYKFVDEWTIQYNALQCFPTKYGVLSNQIGSGDFGIILSLGNNTVVKFVACDTYIPHKSVDSSKEVFLRQEDFILEAKQTTHVSELGVGPKIFTYSVCDAKEIRENTTKKTTKRKKIKLGYLVMENLDISLKEYRKWYRRKYERNIEEFDSDFNVLQERLKANNIVHPDLQDGNIMFNIDAKKNYVPGTMKFVDWSMDYNRNLFSTYADSIEDIMDYGDDSEEEESY
jgi:hypothetical protein